jgi:propionyl-CoA carboxylase alpha chain
MMLSVSSKQTSKMLLRHLHSNHGAAAVRCFGSMEPFSQNPEKPYKVMVANRGEIVQRVAKTCRQYPDLFETVVVHSTADTKAPFAAEHTGEKVCIGPAAASQSYLNVAKILQTIEETESRMVHPGYGFLSENAEFATTITNAGVRWLGPPPHAVKEMGDKLRSKEVALEAGVNIVPGFEGVLESVDQALSVAQDIGYPILLKAAAGGGGKGMRVCKNDKDLKEAYNMTKSEAKSFFSDDRLLIEKFIVNPHHIEFQVICCKKPSAVRADTNNPDDFDVVVFPERECSIQRRNQKVIEESPSVLLTDEMRMKMVEQVKMLCRTVGYESAGTVEFLVEEASPGVPKDFFFLEMNTRLQVEHPVSEAVAGVDLVKGMLWIGAGWGLPEEFKTDEPILPWKGHGIEARIYAEDPLRGYLPSTGALRPYVEPFNDMADKVVTDMPEYCRMDSGVANGHVVTPFYDPMLSKAIYYAPTRLEAVEGLANALDQYVIQGVDHNANLVNCVLRNESFKEGDTPTSFLDTHFPEGFKGVQLTNKQQRELAVSVAMIRAHKDANNAYQPKGSVVVQLGGMFGKAYKVTLDGDVAKVQYISKKEGEENGTEKTITIDAPLDYQPQKYLASASLDGLSRYIQVSNSIHLFFGHFRYQLIKSATHIDLKNIVTLPFFNTIQPRQVIKEAVTGEMFVQMYGANMPVVVQSEREFELSKHMHEPEEQDTSDIVVSPMPGTVISYAVEPGEHVEVGQELCIIEAMKMQNIIRSPREGIIASLHADVGASVTRDQLMVELEPEVKEEAA